MEDDSEKREGNTASGTVYAFAFQMTFYLVEDLPHVQFNCGASETSTDDGNRSDAAACAQMR